jgi:hypothetical protein
MPITTLTIDGVTKPYQLGSFNLSKTANGRGRCTFAVLSSDASYRPDLDVDVVIEEDGVPIFGGLVAGVRERGAAGVKGDASIITEIDAVDYNVYTDFRIVSRTFPAGTVEDFLTIIVAEYLGAGFYGVTLDAGQVTGPSLPELAITTMRLTELMNNVAQLTADAGEPFVWRIDESKVLSMYQPTSEPAPFDIEDPLPIAEVRSDITVEIKRGANYGNRIIVYIPPVSEANHVETFTGDGVATTFTLQYTPAGFPTGGGVTVDAVFETLSLVGGGGMWEFDPVTNSIERVVGTPANGAVITITFNGTFTVNVDAEDAGEIAAVGLREKLIMPDVLPSDVTAQQYADSELARSIFPVKTVRYKTLESGIKPGMSQLIDVARRNVTETGLVSDVVMRDLGTNLIQHEITVMIDGSFSNLGRGFRDRYKSWDYNPARSRSTGLFTVGGGTPPGTGGGSGEGWTYVNKTADETVNNSTTLQNDDHLFFPVVANARYQFEIVLYHRAISTAPDLKYGFTYPSGTTIAFGGFGELGSRWSAGSSLSAPSPLFDETQTGGTGSATNTGQPPSGHVIKGRIRTAGTAGTIQFQWAQNTLTVGDSTIEADSYLRYRRMQ